MIITYKEYEPQLGVGAFVEESAMVLGRVTLGEQASVWYGAVLRGDINEIHIGKYTNLQDLCVGHVEDDLGLYVGDYVTVGHSALLHGCVVRDGVLVGMGAIVLDGAEVGENAQVAAGAVVPPRMTVPPGTLVMGTPARVKRELTPNEITANREMAEKYARRAAGLLLNRDV